MGYATFAVSMPAAEKVLSRKRLLGACRRRSRLPAPPSLLSKSLKYLIQTGSEIEVVLLCQMPHAGDEGLIERAIVGPFGKHLVDCRVMDHGGPVAGPGHRQALPLHT